MQPKPNRVLALARVSGQAQATDGSSLEAQSEAFATHCRILGLPTPTVYVEVESGSDTRQEYRAEVERLIREARQGDLVLVTKVDRWSRNLPWGVASVRELVKRGVAWRSIGEGIDAGTHNGDFVLGIMVAVAEQELRRIRERTVGSRQRLRAQGFHVEGLAPLGYRVEARRLVIDEATAPAVRLMFALCIAGRSCREIAAELRQRWPSLPADHASVARRIRDRRYVGESSTAGAGKKRPPPSEAQWIVTHAAIVDADTWHRAQDALTSRVEGGRRHGDESRTAGYLLRGVIHCGHCGGAMSAHAPAAAEPGYYVCLRRTERRSTRERCVGPIVRQDAADEQVEREALAALERAATVLARPAVRKPKEDLDAERSRQLKRRQRVVSAIADGVVTSDDARATLAEIDAALAAIEARRSATVAPADRGALLGQVETLRRVWAAMSVAEKREALRFLVDAVEAHSTAERKWQRGAWRIEVRWHDFG